MPKRRVSRSMVRVGRFVVAPSARPSSLVIVYEQALGSALAVADFGSRCAAVDAHALSRLGACFICLGAEGNSWDHRMIAPRCLRSVLKRRGVTTFGLMLCLPRGERCRALSVSVLSYNAGHGGRGPPAGRG